MRLGREIHKRELWGNKRLCASVGVFECFHSAIGVCYSGATVDLKSVTNWRTKTVNNPRDRVSQATVEHETGMGKRGQGCKARPACKDTVGRGTEVGRGRYLYPTSPHERQSAFNRMDLGGPESL